MKKRIGIPKREQQSCQRSLGTPTNPKFKDLQRFQERNQALGLLRIPTRAYKGEHSRDPLDPRDLLNGSRREQYVAPHLHSKPHLLRCHQNSLLGCMQPWICLNNSREINIRVYIYILCVYIYTQLSHICIYVYSYTMNIYLFKLGMFQILEFVSEWTEIRKVYFLKGV